MLERKEKNKIKQRKKYRKVKKKKYFFIYFCLELDFFDRVKTYESS